MDKIRILVVLGNTGRGGAQTYAVNVLRNIDRAKFQMDFAFDELKGGYYDEIVSFGSEIIKIPRFKIYNWIHYVKEWKKLLHKGNYDIVHGHVSGPAKVYLKISKKYGCSTILHSHSAGYRGNIIERFLKKILCSRAKKYADYWLSCSDKAADRLFGVDYEQNPNYYEIPNAINAENYLFNEDTRNDLRDKLGLTPNCFLVGHVGSLSAPKNHVFLLEVFKQIQVIKPDSKLIIVGDGPLEKSISDYAEALKVKDNVIFTGNVSNPNDFMMAMDVMVFPSLFEGLPITVVEAQATGLYTLISDTITKSVSITDAVKVLSLKDGYDKWAEASVEKCTPNRAEYNEKIANSKFQMSNSIELITRIYEEIKEVN